MRINQQVAINTTETVEAKLTFDMESQIKGVVIKGYHTGNDILNSSEFMKEPLENQKKISFSGAGASHQNRSEEPAIKTVVTMEMTMLIHAAHRRPE